MKKRLLLVAAATLMFGAANAQREVAKFKGYFSPCFGQLTKSGKSVLIAKDENQITIYNTEMNVENTFTVPLKEHSYTNWYEEATFAPTGFTYAFYVREWDDKGNYVEGFTGNPVEEFEGIDFSGVKTPEQLLQKLNDAQVLQEGYDWFAFTDFKGNPALIESNKYFHYPKSMGYKYPNGYYWALVDGKVHLIKPSYGTFVGENIEWSKVEGSEYTMTISDDIEGTEFYDMDNSANADWKFSFSQTLFNDDDQWEYAVRQYKVVDITDDNRGYSDYYRVDDEHIYMRRPAGQTYETDKCVVMNDAGNVCYTLTGGYKNLGYFGGDEGYWVCRMNGKNYLVGNVYENGEDWEVLYEIEKESSSIREVTRVKGSRVTDEEGALMVEVDESMAGSDVFVSNAAGQIVGRGHVKMGETNARIAMPTRTPGVYVVSLKRDGKTVDSHKMMFK